MLRLKVFAVTCISALSAFILLPTPAAQAEPHLVTVSGHVVRDGVGLAGTSVTMWPCQYSGVSCSGSSITDSSGFYSFDVPAGAVGALQIGTQQDRSPDPIFQGTSSTFTIPDQDMVQDFVLPKLVALDLTFEYSDGTAVPRWGANLATGYPPIGWPNVSLPVGDSGSLTGFYFVSPYGGCDWRSNSTCRFYVPAGSTSNIHSSAYLGGGLSAGANDTVTVGDTNTSYVVVIDHAPVKLVTVSGHVVRDGVGLAGTSVTMWPCQYSGVSCSGSSITDSSGFYSFDVPAGAVGALQIGTQQDRSPDPIFQGTSSTFTIPDQDMVQDFVLPKLVALDLTFEYSDGTAVPRWGANLATGYPPIGWPNVSLPVGDSGSLTGFYFVSPYGGCDWRSNSTCRFYVPAGSTSNIHSSAYLGGGLSAGANDTVTVGDTNTSYVVQLKNLAQLFSQGANSGTVDLVTPTGTEIQNELLTSATGLLPTGNVDLVGRLYFEVSGLTSADPIQVSFVLPNGQTPNQIFKNVNGQLVDMTQYSVISGQTVTVTISDGGPGDEDGVVNGVIVDPIYFTKTNATKQSALSITNVVSKRSSAVAKAITVTVAGGSGTGIVTLATSSPGCTISGLNVVRSASYGACVVIANKAAQGAYAQASSAPITFTFTPLSQSALKVTNSVKSATVGTSILVTTSGGTGTGVISISTTTPGCTTSGLSVVRISSPGDCVVTATKAGSSLYAAVISATVTFTFKLLTQAALTITNSKDALSSVKNIPIIVSTSGGSGAGAISLSTTTAGCRISGLTVVRSTSGSCVVTATKAASGIYSAITSKAVTFKFS